MKITPSLSRILDHVSDRTLCGIWKVAAWDFQKTDQPVKTRWDVSGDFAVFAANTEGKYIGQMVLRYLNKDVEAMTLKERVKWTLDGLFKEATYPGFEALYDITFSKTDGNKYAGTSAMAKKSPDYGPRKNGRFTFQFKDENTIKGEFRNSDPSASGNPSPGKATFTLNQRQSWALYAKQYG